MSKNPSSSPSPADSSIKKKRKKKFKIPKPPHSQTSQPSSPSDPRLDRAQTPKSLPLPLTATQSKSKEKKNKNKSTPPLTQVHKPDTTKKTTNKKKTAESPKPHPAPPPPPSSSSTKKSKKKKKSKRSTPHQLPASITQNINENPHTSRPSLAQSISLSVKPVIAKSRKANRVPHVQIPQPLSERQPPPTCLPNQKLSGPLKTPIQNQSNEATTTQSHQSTKPNSFNIQRVPPTSSPTPLHTTTPQTKSKRKKKQKSRSPAPLTIPPLTTPTSNPAASQQRSPVAQHKKKKKSKKSKPHTSDPNVPRDSCNTAPHESALPQQTPGTTTPSAKKKKRKSKQQSTLPPQQQQPGHAVLPAKKTKKKNTPQPSVPPQDQPSNTAASSTQKKKKKNKSAQSTAPQQETPSDTDAPSTKKKKKKGAPLSTVPLQQLEPDTAAPSTKKKKKKGAPLSTVPLQQQESDTAAPSKKKKKEKRPPQSSLPLLKQTCNTAAPSSQNKKKRKKKNTPQPIPEPIAAQTYPPEQASSTGPPSRSNKTNKQKAQPSQPSVVQRPLRNQIPKPAPPQSSPQKPASEGEKQLTEQPAKPLASTSLRHSFAAQSSQPSAPLQRLNGVTLQITKKKKKKRRKWKNQKQKTGQTAVPKLPDPTTTPFSLHSATGQCGNSRETQHSAPAPVAQPKQSIVAQRLPLQQHDAPATPQVPNPASPSKQKKQQKQQKQKQKTGQTAVPKLPDPTTTPSSLHSAAGQCGDPRKTQHSTPVPVTQPKQSIVAQRLPLQQHDAPTTPQVPNPASPSKQKRQKKQETQKQGTGQTAPPKLPDPTTTRSSLQSTTGQSGDPRKTQHSTPAPVTQPKQSIIAQRLPSQPDDAPTTPQVPCCASASKQTEAKGPTPTLRRSERIRLLQLKKRASQTVQGSVAGNPSSGTAKASLAQPKSNAAILRGTAGKRRQEAISPTSSKKLEIPRNQAGQKEAQETDKSLKTAPVEHHNIVVPQARSTPPFLHAMGPSCNCGDPPNCGHDDGPTVSWVRDNRNDTPAQQIHRDTSPALSDRFEPRFIASQGTQAYHSNADYPDQNNMASSMQTSRGVARKPNQPTYSNRTQPSSSLIQQAGERSTTDHPAASTQPNSTLTRRQLQSRKRRNGFIDTQSGPPSKRARCDQSRQPSQRVPVHPQASTQVSSAEHQVPSEQGFHEPGSCIIPQTSTQVNGAAHQVPAEASQYDSRRNMSSTGQHAPLSDNGQRRQPSFRETRRAEPPGNRPQNYGDHHQQVQTTERRHSVSRKPLRRKSFQTKRASPTGEYYGIRCGREGFSGVLTDWGSCSKLVIGYCGAVYAIFDTWDKAEEFADRDGIGASLNHRDNVRHFFGRRRNGAFQQGSIAQLPWELENEPKVVSLVTGAAWHSFGMGAGLGGYSVFLSEYSPYNFAGVMEGHVTEIRLYLKAALEALEIVHQHGLVVEGGVVELYTLSEEVKNGLDHWLGRWDRTGKWTRYGKEVGNQDLWKAVLWVREELKKKGTRIHIIWVRGPGNVPAMQRAISLARQCFSHMQDGQQGSFPQASGR